MTVQHIADPARGTYEFLLNSGMERDGIGQRICLHADQTLRWENDTYVTECDYCPATAWNALGLRVELPAWYWPVRGE